MEKESQQKLIDALRVYDMALNEDLKHISDFDEYLRASEPDKKQRAENWSTAIGLQDVDGLKTSNYLKETARLNIEGEITIDEARERIRTYYKKKVDLEPDDEETHEADNVSANIAKILGESSFALSVVYYTSIHRRLFEGVFVFAGQVRDYDISKKEWVLRGDTVNYMYAADLRRALEYDFEQERSYLYKNLPIDQVIEHITKFISGLWQIHAFGEGNTRTTAVFCIKYLQTLGFMVDNTLFAQKSWYFRNALVRANYHNYEKGVDYEPIFLIRFFRNLLLGENNDLRNRYMLIDPPVEWQDEVTKMKSELDGSAPDKHPTSTRQVPDKLQPSSVQVEQLIKIIGKEQYSIKEMLVMMKLKDRENFMNNYINPAKNEGFVTMLYPDNPHHSQQKYLLTLKGHILFESINH